MRRSLCHACSCCLHPEQPVREISQGYPRGSRQLLGPFNSAFGPKDTAEWFRSRGVALKTEADGRMFPTTDSSQTVIDCLTKAAQTSGVSVMTGVKVSSVRKSSNSNGDECFTMNISTSKPIDTIADSLDVVPLGDVNSNSNRHTYRLAADYVLLATGSSREGHQWAEQLGHNIVSPVPSLFTLTIADSRIDGLAGVAVQCIIDHITDTCHQFDVVMIW
eukprot:13961-Heterococcus_DN1.PRE.3